MRKGIIHKKYAFRRQFKRVEGFGFGAGIFSPPLMTAWCYYIDGLLIDTGISLLRKEAVEMISAFRPEKILLTHHHEDHSGNACAISRKTGTEVFGHTYTGEKLSKPFPVMPYQHLLWGKTEPVHITPLPDMIETKNHKLIPLHTPGHSKDHTVYIESDMGWVFSGDLFLGTRIKFFRKDEVFADQISSLKKLLSFDFDTIFCSHNPKMKDGRKHICEKLDFLENLYGTIGDLSTLGISEKEIIERLDNGQDRIIKLITGNNVSYAHMVRSALKTIRE